MPRFHEQRGAAAEALNLSAGSNEPAPQVSVLMSVHNAATFLPAAMESILNQTFAQFEFIVVDDGSSDASTTLLGQYAARDRRVRWIRQANQGLTRSLNTAAAMARGSLLARMDADDISLPERLLRQVSYLESHPDCVALGGQALYIDEEGWPVGPWQVPLDHEAIDRRHLAGLGGGLIHPAAVIRRNAFERVGGYDVTLPAAQDYDLWLRLAEVGRLANLPDLILRYRLHLASVTSSRRAVQTECLVKICGRARERRKLTGQPAGSPRRYPNLAPYRQRLQWVRLALGAGYFTTAEKHARLALREAGYRPDALAHFLAARILSVFRRQAPEPAMSAAPGMAQPGTPSASKDG